MGHTYALQSWRCKPNAKSGLYPLAPTGTLYSHRLAPPTFHIAPRRPYPGPRVLRRGERER